MRRPESKLDLFEIIIPYLQAGLTRDVPQQVATTIKKDADEQKVSIPAILTSRIYREGLQLSEHFERTFRLPRGFLEGEEQLTRFSILYSMAPGQVKDTEDYIKGTEVVDKAIEDAMEHRYIRGEEPHVNIYTANLHIVLAAFAQDLKADPTGIKLIDRIAYEPPLPNSPLSILHSNPPLIRIIQLGAERYKKLYQAISEQTSPQNS